METEVEKDDEDDAEDGKEPAPVPPHALPAHLAKPTPATVNPNLPPPPVAAPPKPQITMPGASSGSPRFGTGATVPLTQLDKAGRPKVDKYFGSRLPPVCKQLGCYVTDDAKFYYCINPHCHKDRKRETKYNRRRKSLVYFFCPKCKSREIQLHLRKSHYECLECAYSWKN
ncbi:MAG TPA: hypothetical protein VI818_04075 [Candidatus Thermoplasmatota archaeon]|nr:hypothetical protein [Candidatus Thermoplasmatota archaeon]